MLSDLFFGGWDGAASLRDGVEAPRAYAWGEPTDVAEIAEYLRWGSDPVAATARPWAAVVHRSDDAVVATCSMTVAGGLFYTRVEGESGPRLVIGPSLGAVVRSVGRSAKLCPDFLQARLGEEELRPDQLPYLGVRRLPPGTSALWRSVAVDPVLHQWCGPDAWVGPEIDGLQVIDAYRRIFDAAVDELVVEGEPICATLSGGLDSSFLVASLLRHATPTRPVHAFVHSPLPEAGLRPRGNWDPDDHPVALAMARRYPELLQVHRVMNTDRQQLLDEAVIAAKRHWYPGVNLGNHLWLRTMSEQAAELGASRLFTGENGNAAYSSDHPYALSHYARRRDWAALRSMLSPYLSSGLPGVRTGWAQLARQCAVDTRAAVARSTLAQRLRRSSSDPMPAASVPSREAYLRWLTGSHSRSSVLAFDGWDAALVDPFRSKPVIELAALITPAVWARGGSPRGLARLIAEGRVPDEIRLRTRRGGQGWDAWFIESTHMERYLMEVLLAADDPDLEPHLDRSELLQEVQSWPWGQPMAAAPSGFRRVLNVLAVAAFARVTRRQLDEMPR
jgi:asparagine synthase (glutamine-hydrolysing)